jgi:hypothetical protein
VDNNIPAVKAADARVKMYAAARINRMIAACWPAIVNWKF